MLDYRPDQGTGFVNLAPAALINYDDVASTELIQPGSRVTYAALFAGADGGDRRISRIPRRRPRRRASVCARSTNRAVS